MKTKTSLPILKIKTRVGDAILEMSAKGFGCVGIISKKEKYLLESLQTVI